MSNNCRSNKTTIYLGKSYPNYCGCGCNPCKCNSSSSSGSGLPSGGTDGDILVKNGSGGIWVSPTDADITITTIYIDIDTDEQTIFLTVIPTDRTLIAVLVDGVEFIKDEDYEVNGQNIVWINPDFDLLTVMTLSIKVI